ncbi:hypothetical protein GH5_05794 [Leishmania sp. Ghana 2012 LV757]|uniref:hypothetical protein n=1 Tax=Leishmania sp. Ghana 2012 LV757 TaxID=2803181 RepID=UPI001B78A854|nr:hypothetical protein GH5_05794 [Leishmania sp. Ghana 2012 LV757]
MSLCASTGTVIAALAPSPFTLSTSLPFSKCLHTPECVRAHSKATPSSLPYRASPTRMAALPGCTLHIAVDEDLSTSFAGPLCAPCTGPNCFDVPSTTPSAAPATLFPNLPSRTHVRGVRQVNAVSQTVVLHLEPSASHGDCSDSVTPAWTSSALTRNTYVVVVLDAKQVPQMLSVATARRCPPHLSGAGPLGWYLDAVVAGVQQANEGKDKPCGSDAASRWTGREMRISSNNQPCTTARTLPARRGSANGGVVHLSLFVVPNATEAVSGRNSASANATGAEAAALFSAAIAWSAARRVMLEVDDVEESLGDRSTSDAKTCRRSHAVPVELDLCTTAIHVQQATQMIAALGNKLLKAWSTSAAAASSMSMSARDTAQASMADAADVRPDTQRKVIPSDFHALYTCMLTEVTSFSERKTMAAVAAFPTMCHLLEYVDGIAASAPAAGDSSGGVASQVPNAVYSTNYGEHRSWNVLNSAIIEALMTEYER